MGEQESTTCITPKPSQSFFVHRIQSKDSFLREKRFLKEEWRIEEKKKKNEKVFLTALAKVIKKGATMTIKIRKWIERPWENWEQQLNKI